MDTDYKFIQVTTATGKLFVLNLDHIVGFKNTSRGCVVKTSNPNFSLTLKTTFEELIAMLPSLMKIEDINQ
jgi:hypothetical protein